MTKRSFLTAARLVLLLALATTQVSFGSSSGVWDAARPGTDGCRCHGVGEFLPSGVPPGAYPPPVPLLIVHGLPDRYAAGETYELSVAVLGPIVPFAGYNLEVQGGTLSAASPMVPEGGRSQTGFRIDECQALENDRHCRRCLPGQSNCTPVSCEVRKSPECPVYLPGDPTCACAANDRGTEACRPCQATTFVSMQAVHSSPAVVPVWTLRWTAPACEFGPVRFYLVGNSVNGNGTFDPADIWSRWPEPRIVAPDESTCSG